MSARRRLLVIADRIIAPGLVPGPVGNALLIEDDRIVAIGPADTLDVPAARLELPGCVVGPGLTDAHIHLTEWALARHTIDLSDADSPGAAAHAIGASAPPGDWIRGRGWNPRRWSEQPHRALLDRAAPGRPVALQSHDMHSLWASTAALERAGVGSGTPDPEGGHIVRDEAGEPTGLLLENAGRLVIDVLPRPGFDEMSAAVREAQAVLHRFGITGVHSFPGLAIPDPAPLPVLESLRAAGTLQLRVLQHIAVDHLEEAIGVGLRSGFGDELLRIGGVKMFLDGALGSLTAWMREPYVGSAQCGLNTLDPEIFRATVQRAAAHGIATTVHAIGDAAVGLAFDVLADPNVRVSALPHRVEHVQCLPADRAAVPASAGIVCSVQPCHLMTDWPSVDRHWGPERGARTYAFRTLQEAGATLAFGSDAPVEPVDPRLGLHAAVQRRDTARQPEGGWFPAESLAPADAFAGYTAGPAVAAGRRGRLGTLVPGAFADLAAWDRDPLDAGDALLDMACVATVVAGRIVHS